MASLTLFFTFHVSTTVLQLNVAQGDTLQWCSRSLAPTTYKDDDFIDQGKPTEYTILITKILNNFKKSQKKSLKY